MVSKLMDLGFQCIDLVNQPCLPDVIEASGEGRCTLCIQCSYVMFYCDGCTFEHKFGPLLIVACRPCTGAMLIFSVSFQI
eukprot:1146819-Pelagomonas_calceolata.AAC.1